MMLVKSKKDITIGPKFFPTDVCGDEGEDDVGEGQLEHAIEDEPNSKCKCIV